MNFYDFSIFTLFFNIFKSLKQQPRMLSEEDQRLLTEKLDKWMEAGPGKMFSAKAQESKLFTRRLKKVHKQLKETVLEMQTRKLSGSIGRPSCALYDAMIYKFGVSNRHQKFWRIVLQIYRALKRLNRQPILSHFKKFTEKLEHSKFQYAPTKKAIRFLGALLLHRILQLDKLRMICARSADCSMGFIELRHFLTFNLMSIAIASDVASEAKKQLQQFAAIYNGLGAWFHRNSSHLPTTANVLNLKSIVRGDGLDPTEKETAKRLKKSDLALLRKEIGGIEQGPEEFAAVDVPMEMGNLAFERFKLSGNRNLLRGRRK